MSKGRAVDVPASIGPVVFGVGVGWVTIRCPRQYEDLVRTLARDSIAAGLYIALTKLRVRWLTLTHIPVVAAVER